MSEGGVPPSGLAYKLDHISDSNIFKYKSCYNAVEYLLLHKNIFVLMKEK